MGDGANVCNSLIVGGLKTGMQVTVACPAGCEPARAVLEFAAAYPNQFTLTQDPKAAAEGADVLVTDAWNSMGRARDMDPLQRQQMLMPYQLNDALLALAKPTVWCSTVCRPKRSRRSPALSLSATRTRFSTRRKTVCMCKRQSWRF